MALFGRKKPTQVYAPPPSRPAGPATGSPRPIPRDLAGVKAEWKAEPEEGFSQGWAFFDKPDLPAGQNVNGAEYLTRGLRAELHNPGALQQNTDTIREGCRRTIILAGRTPREIAWQSETASMCIRLGLMLTKVNGWQPTQYGGDGSITDADLDVDRPDLLVAAIAPETSQPSEALRAFFDRPL